MNRSSRSVTQLYLRRRQSAERVVASLPFPTSSWLRGCGDFDSIHGTVVANAMPIVATRRASYVSMTNLTNHHGVTGL